MTWLLLRGLLREVDHWGAFLPAWRAHFPRDEVLALDLPGCGAQHREVAPARVSDLLAHMRHQVLEQMRAAGGDPGPLGLVGLSLGGMVVEQWRRQHPAEVAAAVILSSSAGGLCRPWQRLRLRGAWHLARAAVARSLEGRERQVLLATSTAPVDREAVVARWAAVARARPVSAENAARLLLAANRFRLGGADGALLPPALVLAGEGDRLVHPICSRRLAQAIGAELQVHPRAGHDLPLDDPRWVLEAVAGWRRRVLDGAHSGAGGLVRGA